MPDLRGRPAQAVEEKRMFQQLSGATRLYPIIGDPVKYVESPARLTTTFEDRGHNGLCIPMQAAKGTSVSS
jgi:hypothetical protein